MSFINKRGVSSITIAGSTAYGDVEILMPGASVDPITGEITLPTGGGGTGQYRETFTLDATDITNKYILVSTDITVDSTTTMNVSGLPDIVYGRDFTVDGTNKKQIKWDTLELDGVLQIGDFLELYYS